MILTLLIALFAAVAGPNDAPEARIRDAATDLLAETYPELAPSLSVRVERVSAEGLTGDVRVRLQNPGVPRAHAKVDVLHEQNGAWKEAGWAILYVAHFDSVAVSMHDVSRGQAVSPSDVTGAWIETTRFHGQPFTMSRFRAIAPDGEAVAERSLSAGEPLREGDLRRPWAVETGDAVALRYERPGFFLELKTRARERGAVDDEIRVYCQDTGATYRARLTAPGRGVWLETL
jgi:flagella basal body P-ring formation protein FlgA